MEVSWRRWYGEAYALRTDILNAIDAADAAAKPNGRGSVAAAATAPMAQHKDNNAGARTLEFRTATRWVMVPISALSVLSTAFLVAKFFSSFPSISRLYCMSCSSANLGATTLVAGAL